MNNLTPNPSPVERGTLILISPLSTGEGVGGEVYFAKFYLRPFPCIFYNYTKLSRLMEEYNL